MSWYSILPPHLSDVETWLIRIFILLGILTIGPWAILIVYDILLYIFRTVTYQIPIIGCRARGAQRPRRTSVAQRFEGVSESAKAREWSLSNGRGDGDGEGDNGMMRKRRVDLNRSG